MIGHRATELIYVIACFLSMAWVVVGLRIYTRAFIVKAFSWDDGWMLYAQLMHTLNGAASIGGALTGSGRLSKDLTPNGMMWALRFWWVCYFSYCLTMIGAKISVGLSLLRYTPITQRGYRWIIHILIYTSVVMGLVYGLAAMFQCKPVEYFWARAIGHTGTCISMDIIVAFSYVMSAIFAACDCSFAILPIFLIKGLNMSRNAKFALIPILSIGWIASAAVIVRLVYLPTFRDPEFLYATVPIALWSEIELSLAITAGSLPTLRPLYPLVAKKLSWRTNLFNTRSYKSVDAISASKAVLTIGSAGKKGGNLTSCSESERKIVDVESEEFVLEDRPTTGGKFMNITKVTNVQVDFENNSSHV